MVTLYIHDGLALVLLHSGSQADGTFLTWDSVALNAKGKERMVIHATAVRAFA